MLGLLLVSLFTLNTAHAVNFFPYDVYGSAKSFSDQVILNPPVPHSQVGAIWAKEKNELAEWTLEVKYRVNGPEHGGKGMAIWYAADRGQGGPVYGSNDLWDGLGLFLIAEADGSGSLRGHLNDRTTSYTKLESAGANPFSLNRLFAKSDADKNSFGKCTFAYRNLGTISSLKLSYNPSSLKVTHDGQLCFENQHITLPKGYFFGISAASSELPDSHELFGATITSDTHATTQERQDTPRQRVPLKAQEVQAPAALDTAMQKVISKLIADSDKMSSRIEEIVQLKSIVEKMASSLASLETSVKAMHDGASITDPKFSSKAMHDQLAQEIRGMESKFLQMEKHIEKQTDHIVASLPPVAGPLKNAVYVIIFVQVILCGAYILYRRKAEEKSKFL